MTVLFLIRHGETQDNYHSRLCGWRDTHLNDKGKEQAYKVGQVLKAWKIDAIYCSDLKRTYETALAIKAHTSCCITQVEGLRELNFGVVEGLTMKEVEDRHVEIYEGIKVDFCGFQFPQGESLVQMHKRVVLATTQIVNNHPHDNVVFVAHSGVIRSIISHLITGDIKYHWSFKIEHGSITVVEIEDDFAVLSKLNDKCHLD